MNNRNNNIPVLLELLLKLILPDCDREYLLHDYEFLYAKKVEEKGKLCGVLWLTSSIAKSLPGFLFGNIYWGSFMLKNYFKISVRNILRHKLFSAINIVGLAAGLACTVLILFWVMDELSYDRFHEKVDNIYSVIRSDVHSGIVTKETSLTPPALASALVDEYPEIIAAARMMLTGWAVTYGENNENIYQEGGAFTDPEFFEIFSTKLIYGSASQLTEPTSIVITERMAKVCFGDVNPIGMQVKCDNNLTFEVTGVMKDFPENSSLRFDFLLPLSVLEKYSFDLSSWDNGLINTYVLTHQSIDAELLDQKISGIIKTHQAESPSNISLLGFSDVHLKSPNRGGMITYVYIFTAIGFFILLIASINFMNLSIAKSSNRAREVGVRKSVGAMRSELIIQYLSESLLVAFLAMIISLIIVVLVLPAVNEISGKTIEISDLLQWNFIFLLVAVTLFTGLGAGIYPAVFLSAFHPVKVLKGNLCRGAGSSIFRNSLLTIQYTLAILLMISTSVVYNQFQYIDNKDLGYDPELILAARMMYGNQEYASIKSELLQHQGVLNVTATDVPVLYRSRGYTYDVIWQGKDPAAEIEFETRIVDLDYFKTFDMNVFQGRTFSKEFSTDTSSYIINQTAAELLGFDQSLDNRITVNGRTGNIIGVVKDFHSNSLYDQIKPVLINYQPRHCKWVCVKISSDNIPATLEFLESKWSRLDPGYEFEYSFMDRRIERMYRADLKMSKLFTYFTVLAIIISCLGLIGLSAFLAEQKRKEISLRKVLGASVAKLVNGFSGNFIKYVLLANLFAWPLAYYAMQKWLSNFAYRIEMNLLDFILPAAVALAIAFITISYQALKSAQVNPVENLRNE